MTATRRPPGDDQEVRWEHVAEGLALILSGLLVVWWWPWLGAAVIVMGVFTPRRRRRFR